MPTLRAHKQKPRQSGRRGAVLAFGLALASIAAVAVGWRVRQSNGAQAA